MALGKTIEFRFEGATWGELRSFVKHAETMGIDDSESVDVTYEDDRFGESRAVGIEAWAPVD